MYKPEWIDATVGKTIGFGSFKLHVYYVPAIVKWVAYLGFESQIPRHYINSYITEEEAKNEAIKYLLEMLQSTINEITGLNKNFNPPVPESDFENNYKIER